jgi:hypothetical protein
MVRSSGEIQPKMREGSGFEEAGECYAPMAATGKSDPGLGHREAAVRGDDLNIAPCLCWCHTVHVLQPPLSVCRRLWDFWSQGGMELWPTEAHCSTTVAGRETGGSGSNSPGSSGSIRPLIVL